MVAFLGGLLIFLGIHSVRIATPHVRERFVGAYGEGRWKAAYSLVAVLSLIWMISGYQDAKIALGFIWAPPVWTRHLAILLMLFSLIALVAAYVPSRIKARLKHPMLVATKIWALAHLLANGFTVHVILFGAFLVWAVADRISVKRRGEPDPAAPDDWRGDIVALVGGTVLWLVLLLWLHEWLFGVAPIG